MKGKICTTSLAVFTNFIVFGCESELVLGGIHLASLLVRYKVACYTRVGVCVCVCVDEGGSIMTASKDKS